MYCTADNSVIEMVILDVHEGKHTIARERQNEITR